MSAHSRDYCLRFRLAVLSVMQALEEYEPRPKMHTSLVASVLRMRTHMRVCEAGVDTIVSHLEKFVETQAR